MPGVIQPFTRSSIHLNAIPPNAPAMNVRSNSAPDTSHGGRVASKLAVASVPSTTGSTKDERSWTSVESTYVTCADVRTDMSRKSGVRTMSCASARSSSAALGARRARRRTREPPRRRERTLPSRIHPTRARPSWRARAPASASRRTLTGAWARTWARSPERRSGDCVCRGRGCTTFRRALGRKA
jgi:hypothetical protein